MTSAQLLSLAIIKKGNSTNWFSVAKSHFMTCRLKKKQAKKSAFLSCDAPPDKSKQLRLIHVIYENDGIVAGNVWV